jgi:hypothetical protein
MIYTLADARTFCAGYVDGGRESTDSKVKDRINEAEMILLQECKSIDLRRITRFYVDAGKTLPMPEMVESVLAVNFNGVPGRVRGMGYEFLDSGPGPETNHLGRVTGEDLRDVGDHYPTFYPVGYNPRRIIALSDNDADFGLKIRIRGWDSFNMEINPSGPGEQLRIGLWQNGVVGTIDHTTLPMTANDFQEITSIVKPVTAGYVSLYSYDTSENELGFLSRYAPHETQPGYRRYEILSKACTGDCYINAMVQLRHVPLRNDSDPLTIQNLMALRYMCQSLHEQSQGNMKAGMSYQSMAIRSVTKQSESKSTDDMIIDFDVDMSFGSIPEI